MNSLKQHTDLWKKGCFTQEYSLKGLTLRQIFKELGLPDRLLHKGANIVYALRLPRYDQFELGGFTKYPTDKFKDYGSKWPMNWSKSRFRRTYLDERFDKYFREGMTGWTPHSVKKTYGSKPAPVSVEVAKLEWLRINNNRKLVKVLPTSFS